MNTGREVASAMPYSFSTLPSTALKVLSTNHLPLPAMNTQVPVTESINSLITIREPNNIGRSQKGGSFEYKSKNK
jgi:hypothetical protein